MGLFRGLGGLEGLVLVRSIYTPRGQRARRIWRGGSTCLEARSGAENLPTAARSKLLKGQNGHEDSTEELQSSGPDRPEVTSGPLLVYEGDSGRLWDHLGIIVESVSMNETSFSKNTHSSVRF